MAENRASIAKRIGRNTGIVMGGNAAAAAFGLITLALNARALGTAGLGVLALILAIATLIERLAAFQTWLPLINLGAGALAEGDRNRVSRLITVAILFDAVAAAAAAVAAVLVVLLAGDWLGLPAEYVGVAAIYMATLVTRIGDSGTGVMRLFDKFGLLTWLRTADPAAQCLVAVVLFIIGAPLSVYVLSFAATTAVANLALFACATHVAARNGAAPSLTGWRAAWSAEWREFWTFSWLMSLMGTLNIIRERAPVLLIGAILGPSAVGVYHVAERIAGFLGLVMWPFSLALYPEAARLATADRFADLQWFVLRIGAIAGAIGLAAFVGSVLLGDIAILIVSGPGYGQAYWPVVLLILGYVFAMAGIGLHSAILVSAGPKALFKATLVPFLVYAAVVVPAVAQSELVGAAVAHIIFYAVWLVVSGVALRTFWFRQARQPLGRLETASGSHCRKLQA